MRHLDGPLARVAGSGKIRGPFFFNGHTRCIWKFLGQAWNQSCRCDPYSNVGCFNLREQWGGARGNPTLASTVAWVLTH